MYGFVNRDRAWGRRLCGIGQLSWNGGSYPLHSCLAEVGLPHHTLLRFKIICGWGDSAIWCQPKDGQAIILELLKEPCSPNTHKSIFLNLAHIWTSQLQARHDVSMFFMQLKNRLKKFTADSLPRHLVQDLKRWEGKPS